MGKSLSNNLSSKHGQKLSNATEKSAINVLKTWRKEIQKTAEATWDLVGNKIAEKISWAATNNIHEGPKISTQIQEAKSIPKEIYIPPERGQQIVDELQIL